MRRFLVPIILFAVGLVALVLGISKVVPDIKGVGFWLCFLGLLLFGLSFIPKPEVAQGVPPPLSPFERIAGMFYGPTNVFQNLRYYPRWLAPVLVITVVSVIYSNAFIQRVTPERIGDQVATGMKDFEERGWTPPGTAEKARLDSIAESRSVVKRVGGAIGAFGGAVTIFAVLAGIYMLILLMFGGRINFWQAMAASASAALPIVVVQKLLSLVLLYIKAPESIHPLIGQNTLVEDNFGILFKAAEHPVLFTLAASFGLLALVELWLTATGLKNAGERVSPTAAWGATISVFVIGLLLKAAGAALFPSFMS